MSLPERALILLEIYMRMRDWRVGGMLEEMRNLKRKSEYPNNNTKD